MWEQINKNIYYVKEVTGIQKYIGLMFQRSPKPLMFKFKKPVKICIHSYFCKPFYALWFLNGKLVDYAPVQPNQNNIGTISPFDMLIEIPTSILRYTFAYFKCNIKTFFGCT